MAERNKGRKGRSNLCKTEGPAFLIFKPPHGTSDTATCGNTENRIITYVTFLPRTITPRVTFRDPVSIIIRYAPVYETTSHPTRVLVKGSKGYYMLVNIPSLNATFSVSACIDATLTGRNTYIDATQALMDFVISKSIAHP